MRRILYMTVGLPRSGKTTWARNQNIPIINPDSIRLSIHGKPFDLKHENLVWWTAKIMVESLFRAGHENIILDATNIKKSARDQWISDEWERAFVVFAEMNLNVLKDRARMTDQDYLIPVIDRMAKEWQPIEPLVERPCVFFDGYETKKIVI